ncbi:MAG: hypothetical protein HZB46_15060 [Solirubrobacterales bacterium]|nr:hypothetical protein [Solirubrobacterales bacterium]
MSSYAALAALAHEEHALVREGRIEELPALAARREALMATLPDAIAPEAVPHLREALRVQALVTALLAEARDGLAAEIARVDRARAGAHGYAAGGAAQASRFSAAG